MTVQIQIEAPNAMAARAEMMELLGVNASALGFEVSTPADLDRTPADTPQDDAQDAPVANPETSEEDAHRDERVAYARELGIKHIRAATPLSTIEEKIKAAEAARGESTETTEDAASEPVAEEVSLADVKASIQKLVQDCGERGGTEFIKVLTGHGALDESGSPKLSALKEEHYPSVLIALNKAYDEIKADAATTVDV